MRGKFWKVSILKTGFNQPFSLCASSFAANVTAPRLSIVIPFFDKQAAAPVLLADMRPIADQLGVTEVLLAGGGSFLRIHLMEAQPT